MGNQTVLEVASYHVLQAGGHSNMQIWEKASTRVTERGPGKQSPRKGCPEY